MSSILSLLPVGAYEGERQRCIMITLISVQTIVAVSHHYYQFHGYLSMTGGCLALISFYLVCDNQQQHVINFPKRFIHGRHNC
jgi:hypothetical protein